jgi:two-component system C4-dicarboxylate transport response regulator DctD
MAHDWPGNVRELRNAAERYVLGLGADQLIAAPTEPTQGLARQMEQVEKVLIEQALRQQRGNVSATCEALGIGRKTLYDKLTRHGIQPDDFR